MNVVLARPICNYCRLQIKLDKIKKENLSRRIIIIIIIINHQQESVDE
jgi:hypothetical protein